MGQLVNGVWHNVWYDTKSTGGRFVRTTTSFRNRIAPGTKFAPEAGRYHLYVSLACPWAHRTLVLGTLKGLFGNTVDLTKAGHIHENVIIPVHVVNPLMWENGWTFDQNYPGSTGDPVNNFKFAYELYTKADPEYTGRVTVPILWDTKEKTIVNNESQEICEIFNSAFDDLEGVTGLNVLPASVSAEETKKLDDVIYNTVNNGVYKCGFATSQEAYNENIGPLFKSLDMLEERLSKQRYLHGSELTLSDIKLWTTLVRFDHVYTTHFKCDKKALYRDYPNLSGYLREIYQLGDVANTVSLKHIRDHYFRSHTMLNPHGIVSIGPDVDWWAAPGREKL